MGPHRGGKQPIGGEHNEREEHENGVHLQHAQQRMGFAGTDELWQKGNEKDRQLRIEDIDQDAGKDDLRR